jgi:hypothetical protein
MCPSKFKLNEKKSVKEKSLDRRFWILPKYTFPSSRTYFPANGENWRKHPKLRGSPWTRETDTRADTRKTANRKYSTELSIP